mmetsp:Transcript_55426/g.166174  ORF Transcript_55426/g.166174 Transcript_55426/m.166174 type:complete len:100 (-) Transcript_55426:11-310(-)
MHIMMFFPIQLVAASWLNKVKYSPLAAKYSSCVALLHPNNYQSFSILSHNAPSYEKQDFISYEVIHYWPKWTKNQQRPHAMKHRQCGNQGGNGAVQEET